MCAKRVKSAKSVKQKSNSSTSASRWFTFTMFNYSPSDIKMYQTSDLLEKYVFQHEVCPETKRPHLQGVVCYKKRVRLTGVNKDFPGCHWEAAKSSKGSIMYCSKQLTRRPGTEVYTKGVILPEELYTITKLKPWQDMLFNTIMNEKRNDRTIHWHWEDMGNVGKTSFARYLCIYFGAFYICGSAADMKFGLADYYNKNNKKFPKIVILDIPRDSVGCSYKGLEQLKNGIFYNTKYESGMCLFNPPTVLVFANEPPDESRMSADRWNIQEIEMIKDELQAVHAAAEAQRQQVGPDTADPGA